MSPKIILILILSCLTEAQNQVTVLVRFEETTVDVGEADGQVTVTLTATPAATQAFQIMFRCFPDSAGATTDDINGVSRFTASFANGATTATSVININNDAEDEATESINCFPTTQGAPAFVAVTGDLIISIFDDDSLNCPAHLTPRFGTSKPTCNDRNPAPGAETYDCYCPVGQLDVGALCGTETDCPSGTGTGSAAGDPHYRTFDQLYYDLFDTCYHVFSKDCEGETFAVYSYTTNQCSGGNIPTCIERAIVEIPKYDSRIILNGADLSVTYQGDVPPTDRVAVITGTSITVQLYDYDVTISFWRWYLQVTASDTYSGKLCGLLGNFDGDSTNDYILPDGSVFTSAVPEFEIAYRVQPSDLGLLDEVCEPQPPQPAPPCTGDPKVKAEAFCAALLNDSGSYAACNDTVDPQQSYNDCVLDQCLCQTDTCGCSAIQDYSDRCQAAGVTTGNPPAACIPECPEGQTYKTCGPLVPATCGDFAGIELPCKAGCFCPDGLVVKDGTCVTPAECTSVIEPPVDPPNPPDPSFKTCRAWGDPHYTTFDGAVHHFQGVCWYTFVKEVNDKFAIYSYQKLCGGQVTCIQRVSIKVAGYDELVNVTLNGAIEPAIADLPPDIFNVILQSRYYTIVIQVPVDIQGVSFKVPVTVVFGGGYDLRVTVPDTFANEVCGLCGNYNGDPGDDFAVLLDNDTKVPNTDLGDFGLSFANYELSEAEDCEVRQAVPEPCEGAKRRRAEIFCEAIRREAEAQGCADILSPLEFINTCVFDHCAGDDDAGNIDTSAACGSAVNYFGRCAELGLREATIPNECLPDCAEGEEYSTCGLAEEPSCLNPDGVMIPGAQCLQGCFCNATGGFVRFEGECIHFLDCPLTVRFPWERVTTEEGLGGTCLELEASGNLNRDFNISLVLSEQLSFGESTADPVDCCCADPVICELTSECNIWFTAGQEKACVFIRIDNDDIVEPETQVTATLVSTEIGVGTGEPGTATITIQDDDSSNRLSFRETSFYFGEGRPYRSATLVQLQSRVDEDIYSIISTESGTAIDGYDYQGGRYMNSLIRSGRTSGSLHLAILRDRLIDEPECFYFSLSPPDNADTFDPPIAAYNPQHAIGWIQGNKRRLMAPNTATHDCHDADKTAAEICTSELVAVVRFELELNPKDCCLGFLVTLREVLKGPFLDGVQKNIFALPVRGCNNLTYRQGQLLLVGGTVDADGDIKISSLYNCDQYVPLLDDVIAACVA